MKYQIILLVCLLATLLSGHAASGSEVYRIDTLGLTDAPHIRSDGYLYSYPFRMNNHGAVAGYSTRFNGSEENGESAWLFSDGQMFHLGFIDSFHADSNGFRTSVVGQLNEQGHVLGYSQRYLGIEDGGRSAWLFKDGVSVPLGMNGAGYIRNDGFKYDASVQLNELGHAIGFSQRFSGSENLGRSAWLYDGSNTIELGFSGPDYTKADGLRLSFPRFMNNMGHVVGTSHRFAGNVSLGDRAWLYDGSNTILLGLIDAEHTRTDGHQRSMPDMLNDQGWFTGSSDRFLGGSEGGRTSWFYDGAQTIKTGLIDSEHTRADGYRFSESYGINATGHVFGLSRRFVGGSLGISSWLYNGQETIRIGLTGDNNTRSDGLQSSALDFFNNEGQVVGISSRYAGMGDAGQSAWVYDGLNSHEIGLTDALHTGSNGYRASHPSVLNQHGKVIGSSLKYNNGMPFGWSNWYYNGDQSFRIGLTGVDNTRIDGYQSSQVFMLNESGQAVGFAERFNGGSEPKGHDAWLYDPMTDQTFQFELSVRNDGFSFSHIGYLSDDGLAVGYYQLFDASGHDLGYRAFSFTVAEGVRDLGLSVDGGLDAHGWEHLAIVLQGNSFGRVVGQGVLEGQAGGYLGFLLTPITADFNKDGFINGRDFLAWQRGESSNPLSAEDLALWQSQFGNGNALNANVAVPEPGGVCLVLVCLGTFYACRGDARSRKTFSR